MQPTVRSAPLLDVCRKHRPVVHLVDVVAGEDQHVRGRVVTDDVDVLVDRVRGAAYQAVSLTRCCAGSSSTNSSNSPRRNPQPLWMWRISECDLYCVSTAMRRMPELMQLDSGKSMIRNLPPKGTAGLARQSVRRAQPRSPAAGQYQRQGLARQPADVAGFICLVHF